MYYNPAQHHRVDDFTPTSTPAASSELRLYTWKNATLGEISMLVQQAIPDLLSEAGSGAQLAFRHIFLDTQRGIFVGKDVGVVHLDVIHEPMSTKTPAATAGAGALSPPLSTASVPASGLFTKDIHAASAGGSSDPDFKLGGGLEKGVLGANDRNNRSRQQEKMLSDFRFVTGDYLDIAITSSAPGFVSPLKKRDLQSRAGGGNSGRSGPIRHQRGGGGGGGPRSGGHYDRGESFRGAGAGPPGGPRGGDRMNPLGDRFAGRLGRAFNDLGGKGNGSSGRNGHGQGYGGRRGPGGLDVDNEPSWKGRGRGR
ncbi:Histone deacetylase complex subunit sap18 [Mortierella claussenii]|nr:Histone deacetylase complex subunit sap18 [Mortierella claussenii]